MRYSTIFAALFVAAPALAQTPAGRPEFAKIVAPFIDEHTTAVARIDVSRLDAPALFRLLTTTLGASESDEVESKVVIAWTADFVRKGGRDIFLTYGPGDFPNLPCLIVPIGDSPPERKDLGELLKMLFAEVKGEISIAHQHGCVCVGTSAAIAVVKARKAIARPELMDALDAGKEGVVQVAFALSADTKKIFEQLAPTLPAEVGGGSIQQWTRGLTWVALKVGPGPTYSGRITVQATDAAASLALQGQGKKAIDLARTSLDDSDVALTAALRQMIEGADPVFATASDGARLTIDWETVGLIRRFSRLQAGLPAERQIGANNLKQLLLALHNYHDTYGHFPTDIRDKDGKPLLSWRVAILPFIEGAELYKSFKLDEPWDSGHNKKLIDKMPRVLASPRRTTVSKSESPYLAPLGKGLMWDEPKGLKISAIADGTSNTIAIVEAADERAVTWSKPADIAIDMADPLKGLLGRHPKGFQAAFADGSVRFISKTIDPKTLWAAFTRAGGEVVKWPQ